ncbi:MAG: inositol monophosphatase family protein [Nitrososphaerales archaeon]
MVEWETVLREAGERVQEIRDGLVSASEGTEKVGEGAGGDTTMRVDQEAEDAIIEVVKQMDRGDLRLVAEEHGESGPRDARWTVIIDPIDGSSNFERGIPFYCTSIAVIEGRSLAGARHGLVRNLLNGDVYYSGAEGPSTKNGAEIRSSPLEDLSAATLGIDLSRTTLPVVRSLNGLIAAVKRQMHFGANALETCFLAEGRLDGFLDVRGRIRVMDMAAGYLIARQAGAVFSDERGGPLDPKISVRERFSVVAGGNPAIHRRILALMDQDRS